MEYIVRRLILNRAISPAAAGKPETAGKPADARTPESRTPEKGPPDGTIALFEYESRVAPNDLEPAPGDHLAGGKPLESIPSGAYLFTQGIAEEAADPKQIGALMEQCFRDASEAVWLESLWRETPLKNKRILVRILSEENKTVYQIFREITDAESRP